MRPLAIAATVAAVAIPLTVFGWALLRAAAVEEPR